MPITTFIIRLSHFSIFSFTSIIIRFFPNVLYQAHYAKKSILSYQNAANLKRDGVEVVEGAVLGSNLIVRRFIIALFGNILNQNHPS